MFSLIRLDVNEPEAPVLTLAQRTQVDTGGPPGVLMRMRPRGGDLSQGATEAVSECG